MLTRRYMVRVVPYKIVYAKLAWVYEFATEENQCKMERWVIVGGALSQKFMGLTNIWVIIDQMN